MRINEDLCLSSKLSGAISIKALKRFVADRDNGKWKQFSKKLPSTGKRVAIVGSGPAGLTAGYYLVKLGHFVTVFEALSKPGGMIRVGIPDYRLPKEILDIEIKEIQDIGVNIRLNSRISSADALFEKGYNAIFLAVGSHRGLKLGIDGDNTLGVIDGVSFLKNLSMGTQVKIGERVAVIGGGNTAIDSARIALRLGALHIQVIYRRSQDEIPASKDEVKAAMEEGIKFSFLTSPTKIVGGKDLTLTCIRNRLGKIDSSGRRRPEAIDGSEFSEGFDNIISAIGQVPEVPDKFDLKINDDRTVSVDSSNLETSRKGIWAGGDAVTGSSSVIAAIAAGRKAAISIDKYFGGTGGIDERLTEGHMPIPTVTEGSLEKIRVNMPRLIVDQRVDNFNEMEIGLREDKALEESSRCLLCGKGIASRCQFACPAEVNIPLYIYLVSEGRYEDAIAIIREKVPFPRILGRICPAPCEEACMGCAICVPYCPMSAICPNTERIVGIVQDECVDCGVCSRANVCPVEAFIDDIQIWPRSVRVAFSNPLVVHKETRVPGRGTEEVKTNEVTGQIKKGFVGVTAEMGRPGVGVRFYDVEKVAHALARANVEFAANNPVTHLMTDKTNGILNSSVLNEKVCSAMIESMTTISNLPAVVRELKAITVEIDSVFSLTISTRLDKNGTAPCVKILEEIGVPLYINGKTNIGLGQPLFQEEPA
ncbi:FAD-dependent oxidoreductase [Chloroflexota bacterium]